MILSLTGEYNYGYYRIAKNQICVIFSADDYNNNCMNQYKKYDMITKISSKGYYDIMIIMIIIYNHNNNCMKQ